MPWSRAKALPPPSNELFDACFRIQREACEAAGRHIPLIVENVRGAQKWVGQAAWHFGSYYLWGDVPVLMPIPYRALKAPGFRFDGKGKSFQTECVKIMAQPEHVQSHSGHISSGWSATQCDRWLRKTTGINGGRKELRRAASAAIAKIPFPLAQHIAKTFKPEIAA